jgi:cytochrome c peroxidase
LIQRNSSKFVSAAIDLRNVALSARYSHTGEVWPIKQTVGIMS